MTFLTHSITAFTNFYWDIINKDLFILFEKYFDMIVKYFETYNFLELTNDELYAHE
jgi:hypothetical protein